jgi:BirA family biotin operon repressor/biotin-[acetyl-CoA-carboxylase] ligase
MIRHHVSTTSTNDEARAWAEADAPHGATVSADAQTAGRGRLGRSWTSPPGANLLMSVVVRGAWPPESVGWIPLAAAVAVAEACGPAFRIKWPNDVLAADGRKVSGVLCEAEWSGGRLRYAIVGIGVNVGAAPPELPATCLAAEGVDTTPAALRDAVRAGLLGWLERPIPEIARGWRERSATLGRRIRVGGVEGEAIDLLADGGLAVRGDDGVVVGIRAGDVQLVG